MNVVLLVLALLSTAAVDEFSVRWELQALYDEASQATLQFTSGSDVDLFHEVFCTPDWVYVDVGGTPHAWRDIRGTVVAALAAPRPASMTQIIREVSVRDGAAATIDQTIVRTIVDEEGRYGPPAASRTVVETTTFRDEWVMVEGRWRMKSRRQVTEPRLRVY